MHPVRNACLQVVILAMIHPVFAESGPGTREQEQFAEVSERLSLSDEQSEQLRPILSAAAESQREILSRYGIDLDSDDPPTKKIGLFQGRRLRGEMSKVESRTMNQLEEILTDRQLDEFKSIQDERRAVMKRRIRGAG